MNRGVLLATVVLLGCGMAATGASAASPTTATRSAGVLSAPPATAEHTDIPAMPPGGGGYSYDAATGRYTAEHGGAIWVPGHYENGKRVEGQWMYPIKKPGTPEGYGR